MLYYTTKAPSHSFLITNTNVDRLVMHFINAIEKSSTMNVTQKTYFPFTQV